MLDVGDLVCDSLTIRCGKGCVAIDATERGLQITLPGGHGRAFIGADEDIREVKLSLQTAKGVDIVSLVVNGGDEGRIDIRDKNGKVRSLTVMDVLRCKRD